MYPTLEPLVQKELKKLLDAKIIFPILHSTWVDNIVIIHNESGKIRICVDFRNLNQASKKDNYLIPPYGTNIPISLLV
jgi:predicted glycosyltransferase involved in capsule biosynthesis